MKIEDDALSKMQRVEKHLEDYAEKLNEIVQHLYNDIGDLFDARFLSEAEYKMREQMLETTKQIYEHNKMLEDWAQSMTQMIEIYQEISEASIPYISISMNEENNIW